jgi:hypothetical protein
MVESFNTAGQEQPWRQAAVWLAALQRADHRLQLEPNTKSLETLIAPLLYGFGSLLNEY